MFSYDDAIAFLGTVIKMGKEQSALAAPTLLIRSIRNDIHLYMNSITYSECIEEKTCIKDLSTSFELDAKKIIALSRQAYVVMWSAIDAFEVLTQTENAGRLMELGLNVSANP